MRLFLLFTVLVLLFSCSKKYDKYKEIPDYITKATGINKAYYEAYDNTLKLWNVSYEELYIPTTNGIAHVIVSGPENGEPVVLFHGMNASSTMWYPNIKALSKKHRVFAIDFILEPGKSHLYNDIESEKEVTDWYKEVLFVLDLDSFHLIGASRGGWLAVHFALNNKKKIKSLILLSPAQTFKWINPSTDFLKIAASLLSSKEKQITQTLESMSSNVANLSDEFIKQYRIAIEKGTSNKLVAKMRPYSKAKLKSLQMPILVLVGDDDMFNNKKTIEIANKLPKGKGVIIQNAGHFLSVDQAAIVNEKMLQFLK